MDKTKAETLQKAVADAVGGDVKAEEIAIKGVQFPVESKIELSTSKSAVDADRAGFETKFKTGLALDLGVLPSDIVVKDIKEASRRRRRGLLSSGVEIDYEVDGAPDGVRAQAIAKEVTSTGGLATLKSETGAEATVPAGTTPDVRAPRGGGAGNVRSQRRRREAQRGDHHRRRSHREARDAGVGEGRTTSRPGRAREYLRACAVIAVLAARGAGGSGPRVKTARGGIHPRSTWGRRVEMRTRAPPRTRGFFIISILRVIISRH